MDVKLTPVIELEIYIEELELPQNGPYWEYPKEWALFKEESRKAAGYSEDLKPYILGSDFYKICEVKDFDLALLLKRHIEDIECGEDDEYTLDQLNSITGGCILSIDEQIILLPQCCSSLSDFESWIDIFSDSESFFYQGHPSPLVSIKENQVIINFNNSAFEGEEYGQKEKHEQISIPSEKLKNAIIEANKELEEFRDRVKELCELKIEGIENILVSKKQNLRF
jgi:hypothetical protein